MEKCEIEMVMGLLYVGQPWYEEKKASYVDLVDEKWALFSLGVVNVFHIVKCDKSVYEITLHVDLISVS